MSGPVRVYKLMFFGFYDTLITRQVLILKYIHKTTWFFIKSFCVKNDGFQFIIATDMYNFNRKGIMKKWLCFQLVCLC